MKTALILLGLAVLMIGGCGVNKDYVAQQISDSEARLSGEISGVRDKTDGNAAEIGKLRSLSDELSKKTDMAINEAKGFENYEIIWSGEINFNFDDFAITEVAEATLNDCGDKMEQYPGSVLEVSGYSDRTGAAKYNLMLGEQRANSAKRFLADRFGISLYRMFVVSYGEAKPVAMPDENNAASKNRRVVLKVWGTL